MKRIFIICFLLLALLIFNTGCEYTEYILFNDNSVVIETDIYRSDTQILVIVYEYNFCPHFMLRQVEYEDGNPYRVNFTMHEYGDLYPRPDCNFIISNIDDNPEEQYIFKIFDKKVELFHNKELEDTLYLCEGLTLEELESDDFDLRSIGF